MIKTELRYLRDKLVMNTNRALGREYIPNIRENLYIEASSICNLRCKFCAYSKKEGPKMVMENSRFFNYVEQAVDLGYNAFGLTPITGEVFTDKSIFDKLEFLEHHPKVNDCHFFSNFTIPDNAAVIRLLSLRKLSILSISLYGYDKKSFVAMTGAPSRLYDKLVSNLNILCENLSKTSIKIEIGWRVEEDSDLSSTRKSVLAQIVSKMRDNADVPVHVTKHYNNWGGLITQNDVKGLNIWIVDERDVYKNGACSLIFYKQQVMADGRVNACACRDANATLCIGDLNKSSLKEILSPDNRTYMQLIENQQNGLFNPICRACDMYRSIYKYHPIYRYHTKRPLTLKQFYREIQCGIRNKTTCRCPDGGLLQTGGEQHI